MIRKITFLTLFLWLMTVTFPVIAQQKTDCLLYTSDAADDMRTV